MNTKSEISESITPNKEATIYYFSGTGNARQTAEWVSEGLRLYGFNAHVQDIHLFRGKEIPNPKKNELIGFCSPTHGFHFPAITRKFIYRFPKSNQGNAFVLNTRAGLRIGRIFIPGLSGLVHYESAIILKYKGYKMVGQRPIDLPSNWLSLHPAVRKRGIDLMYERQKRKVQGFTSKLAKGEKDMRAYYDIIQDALISPIALGYLFIGRFALSKSFIASHECTRCGLCERSCPVNAIHLVDKRMFWTYKCESCMQCMNQCPVQAIQTAHGFFIGLCYLFMVFGMGLFSKLLFSAFPSYNTQWLLTGFGGFIVESALFLPFLFLGYRIMHWLLRFKWIDKLVVWTSLTAFRFWGRYKAGLRKH